MTIEELIVSIRTFRSSRNWQKDHTLHQSLLGLISETGELTDHVRFLSPSQIPKYVKQHKEELSDELVDVLYWILVMADDLDINIEKAFAKKMEKNATKYPLLQEKK